MKLAEPTGKAPHPAAATTVRVTGVADAVPPVKAVTFSQVGSGFTVLSTVNGVPKFAGDVTFTATEAPGV